MSAKSESSRLDRLVLLLETGTTALIRNTAADQLGDIQKKHPHELFNLLNRVVPYLRSKSWETRVAAARALGGIVGHADKFEPDHGINGATPDEAIKEEVEAWQDEDYQLRLQTLDVNTILKSGKKLVGSEGKHLDYALAGMDPQKRLEHQKAAVTRILGFDSCADDMVDRFELSVHNFQTPRHGLPAANLPSASSTEHLTHRTNSVDSPVKVSAASPTPVGEMSARQMNMLKRKNKKEMKHKVNKMPRVDFSERRPSINKPDSAASRKRSADDGVKEELSDDGGLPGDAARKAFSLLRNGDDDKTKLISEFKGVKQEELSDPVFEPDQNEEDSVDWPFERLCEILMVDIFDHNWEVRHGAACGLREIVQVHGAGAGRQKGQSFKLNEKANEHWLDDLACRLCCVFILDRFGDYGSDTVVAPVRETAGQALAALLKHASERIVKDIYDILFRLIMQTELSTKDLAWQACYGAMVGMRYLVAIRHHCLLVDDRIMSGVMEVVITGLTHADDDIRAVSAATMVPVTEHFIKYQPQALKQLVAVVWECLSDLSDDLSSSTGSVMDLLAKLCTYPEILDIMHQNAREDPNQTFTELVPRLYPFLRHTITTVRVAVLRALLTFLNLEGSKTLGWVNGKAVRLIFQNLVVERNEEVLALSSQVLNTVLQQLSAHDDALRVAALQNHITPFIEMATHPIGTPLNHFPMHSNWFIRPSGRAMTVADDLGRRNTSPAPDEGKPEAKRRKKSVKTEAQVSVSASTSVSHNIDRPMIDGDVSLVGSEDLIRARLFSCKALAQVMMLWPQASRVNTFSSAIIAKVSSPFATTQIAAGMIVEAYAAINLQGDALSEALLNPFLSSVEQDDSEIEYSSEMIHRARLAHKLCWQVRHTLITHIQVDKARIPHIADPADPAQIFRIEQGQSLLRKQPDLIKGVVKSMQMVAEKRLPDEVREALKVLIDAESLKTKYETRIKASAAAVIVASEAVPKKPTFIINGLMHSITDEESSRLQSRSASSIVRCIKQMVQAGRTSVFKKIVGNLADHYCSDESETPDYGFHSKTQSDILSLYKELHYVEAEKGVDENQKHYEEKIIARIKTRGTKAALEQLSLEFGPGLLSQLPSIPDRIAGPLQEDFGGDDRSYDAVIKNSVAYAPSQIQKSIDGMSLLKAMLPTMHEATHGWVMSLTPLVIRAIRNPSSAVRYMAAKCFATICSVIGSQAFTLLVQEVLPFVNHPLDIFRRLGGIETIFFLVEVMKDRILPYVVFLITPVLGRMSDTNQQIRNVATTSFATVVKLVPLEEGIPDPPGLSAELLAGRESERQFIAQMLNPKNIEPFEMPVVINAQLRGYQQEGVNWLAFLNRYNLHGILCDDMGLGKTLQTICMVASDHHMRAEKFSRTGDDRYRRLPSLIVCPPSLSGHWVQEIKAFAPFLRVAAYVGSPAQRAGLKSKLQDVDIVVTSYNICRDDNDFLQKTAGPYNYCVLDEGHMIKNSKSAVFNAVTTLSSHHRLILSGTPIQNNVLELWALFEFLMPGFLGEERRFKDLYAKPIANSRNAKANASQQEKGALAVEALHKQVLPFLLRRLKEEVLDDLPPKIIQNYYCDTSELQKKLFEDFHKQEGKNIEAMASRGDKESKQHIFTALNYMKKLCNSPVMVLKENNKQYAKIQEELQRNKTSIEDPRNAPKLLALRDLLTDCGIGVESGAVENGSQKGADKIDHQSKALAEGFLSQHRALIFFQMKEMLDIVEREVFKKMLPTATYTRLDGDVPAAQRQDIVNKFNRDPSIDVLLLTTKVGGLGLNLTGADTVIFVEHDWNPQNDIQAMDRAHRIGQKKVVNVHRLITRGTLEEKILTLQNFKIDLASQVVNQQNAGLGSMGTDQILDLFNPGDSADNFEHGTSNDGTGAVDEITGEIKEKGKKGFLDGLDELWDEKQYEEFNTDDFISKMKV